MPTEPNITRPKYGRFGSIEKTPQYLNLPAERVFSSQPFPAAFSAPELNLTKTLFYKNFNFHKFPYINLFVFIVFSKTESF